MRINSKRKFSSKARVLTIIFAFLLLIGIISTNSHTLFFNNTIQTADSISTIANSGSTLQILVKSVDMSGKAIKGPWMILSYQNGTTITNGFTPKTFAVMPGTTYVIQAGSNWKYRFSHWNNGNTTSYYTITPKQNVTIAAFYATLPGAPSLVAKAVSSSQINLNWTANYDSGSPIIGYRLEKTNSGCSTWSTILPNTTATSYSDSGLIPGTTYMYRINAINSVGEGFPTTAIAITNSTSANPLSLTARLGGNTTGIYFPLYDLCELPQVFAAKNAYPGVPFGVNINPESGPGTGPSQDWASAITQLKDAGAVVMGYVPTGYGLNSTLTVGGMVTSYQQFYPGMLDGIMFDEVSSSCTYFQFYKEVSDYARSIGLSYIRANVGTDMCKAEVNLFDQVGIYESPDYPKKSTLISRTFSDQYSKSKIGFEVTVHSQPNFDPQWLQMATKYLKWVYITDQQEPDPYNKIPSYFDQYLSDLSNMTK